MRITLNDIKHLELSAVIVWVPALCNRSNVSANRPGALIQCHPAHSQKALLLPDWKCWQTGWVTKMEWSHLYAPCFMRACIFTRACVTILKRKSYVLKLNTWKLRMPWWHFQIMSTVQIRPSVHKKGREICFPAREGLEGTLLTMQPNRGIKWCGDQQNEKPILLISTPISCVQFTQFLLFSEIYFSVKVFNLTLPPSRAALCIRWQSVPKYV